MADLTLDLLRRGYRRCRPAGATTTPPAPRRAMLERWGAAEGSSPVFPDLARAYGLATLDWQGIAVDRSDGADLSWQLAQIVDGFGFAMPDYLRGWAARLRANRWACDVVRDARAGRRETVPGSNLARQSYVVETGPVPLTRIPTVPPLRARLVG